MVKVKIKRYTNDGFRNDCDLSDPLGNECDEHYREIRISAAKLAEMGFIPGPVRS